MKTKSNFNDIRKYLKTLEGRITYSGVIFMPTSLYAPYFIEKGYKVGLQDIFFEKEGSSPLGHLSAGAWNFPVNHVFEAALGD